MTLARQILDKLNKNTQAQVTTESVLDLEEKLITFGGRAYPQFGQVVIMAGGAGSGKGFQLENLLGIEGKVMDVDALKQAVIASERVAQGIKERTGKDVNQLNLRNPEDVKMLHALVADKAYDIPNKVERNLFSSIAKAHPERKPNIIFDVTLKDTKKLDKICANAEKLGYDKRNIHIVWVVNDVEVAKTQNQNRSRVVPEEILMHTHEGAALTMKLILDAGDKLRGKMDGDIWLTFNKAKVDTEIATSDKGGMYITKAFYVKAKEQGKAPVKSTELAANVYARIVSYVPKAGGFAEAAEDSRIGIVVEGVEYDVEVDLQRKVVKVFEQNQLVAGLEFDSSTEQAYYDYLLEGESLHSGANSDLYHQYADESDPEALACSVGSWLMATHSA